MKLLKLGIILAITIVGFILALNWNSMFGDNHQDEVLTEDSIYHQPTDAEMYKDMLQNIPETPVVVKKEPQKPITPKKPKAKKTEKQPTPVADATKKGAVDAVKKNGVVDATFRGGGAVDAQKK